MEIVGEAASRVSPECRAAMVMIPWKDLIGMRNRLIHAYFDINRKVLWQSVKDEMPTLIAEIENALLQD